MWETLSNTDLSTYDCGQNTDTLWLCYQFSLSFKDFHKWPFCGYKFSTFFPNFKKLNKKDFIKVRIDELMVDFYKLNIYNSNAWFREKGGLFT